MRASSLPAATLLLATIAGMSAPRAGEAPTRIAGLGTEFIIDGVIDPLEWSQVYPEPLAFEIEPRNMEPTEWDSRARISHDGRHLLVAVEARDPSPDAIVASRGARDTVGNNEDYVAVMIDAEGTQQRHFEFRVNAAGTLDDRIEGGSGGGSPQWSGTWHAAAMRTSRGYDVEISIPLRTLNVSPNDDQELDLAINVTRKLGRGRRETVALIPVDMRRICEECQYGAIRLTGLADDAQSVQLRPYLAASRATTYPAGESSDSHSSADPGLDVLWNMGRGRKLVATLNPDFSEVAPDQIQFDVNRRNAVIFNENRTFFTENAGVFSFALPVVYTRSISDPSAALAYSSTGEHMTVAALVAKDRVTSFIAPSQHGSRIIALDGGSETFLGRLQRNGGEGRRAGMLVAARSGDGYGYQLAALDGRLTIGARQSMDAAFAVSHARLDDAIAADVEIEPESTGMEVRVAHNYRAPKLSVSTFVQRSTPDFRTDTGNQNRVGTNFYTHEWGLNLPQPTGGWISSFNGSIRAQHADLLHSRDHESVVRAMGFLNFTGGSTLDGHVEGTSERYRGVAFENFDIGGGFAWQINGAVRVNAALSLVDEIDLLVLEQARGPRMFSGFSAKVGSTFSVNGNFTIDSLHGETTRNFVTRSALLKANWSPRLGHTLSMQANWGATRQRNKLTGAPSSSSDRLRGQLLYLYQRADRSSFHVGVNLGGSGKDGIGSVRRTDELIFSKVVLNLDWGN